TTAVAQAATSPILIPTFGRLTLYAIPANLLIGPLCVVAFPLAMIAAVLGLFSSTAEEAVAIVAGVPAGLSISFVRWMAALPGANSRTSLAEIVPEQMWYLPAAAAVILVSRECRGGILRVTRNASNANSRTRSVMAGSLSGAVLTLAAILMF